MARIAEMLPCSGKRVLIGAIITFSIFTSWYAGAQQLPKDTMQLMAYNLLNYQASKSADTLKRNAYFRTIITATQPDVLAVEEIKDDASSQGFLNHVMKRVNSDYVRAPFKNGFDSNSSLYFLSSKYSCNSNTVIATALRDINQYTLTCKETNDVIYIYVVHLKASNGPDEANDRLAEVNELRKVTDALPAGSSFIVCGDFNFYGADEPGYQRLLESVNGKNGEFYDPLNLPGVWNNFNYAIHHTQSPRYRNFDGGSGGGMDDRFDLILYSSSIKNTGGVRYLPNSNKAFGNDGNHYNDSINQMPNTAVSLNIANALHYGADHIPVMAKFTLGHIPTAVQPEPLASLVSIYPNPASDKCTVTLPSNATLTLFDINGVAHYFKQENTGTATIAMEHLPHGVYFLKIVSEQSSYTAKIIH